MMIAIWPRTVVFLFSVASFLEENVLHEIGGLPRRSLGPVLLPLRTPTAWMPSDEGIALSKDRT